MKKFFIIQFTYFYLITTSRNSKNDNKDKFNYFLDNFEYESSLKFLEISNTTSCFSPVCYFYFVYLMCESNSIGSEKSELGKRKRTEVLKVYNVNDENFKTVCCLYTKNKQNEIERKIDGWHIENFNDKNVKRIYEQHVSWFNLKKKRNILTPIIPSDFEKYNSIYLTVAMFKDDWANKFKKVQSCVSDFFELKGRKFDRLFLITEDEIKYDLITGKNESYHIVALPYVSRNGSSYSRYMVYLIPISIKGDPFDKINFGSNLTIIWKNFNKRYSKIKKAIKNLKNKKIKLQIPMIRNLKSDFNMIDLICKSLNLVSTNSASSKMKTYIHTDENGTEAMNYIDKHLYNNKFKEDLCAVKANVPHISFIFDMDLEKVLLITKDLGQIYRNKTKKSK